MLDRSTPAGCCATDLDHGRDETRRHVVCHDIAWLTSDRRDPDAPRFPGLKAIAMVEPSREADERSWASCMEPFGETLG